MIAVAVFFLTLYVGYRVLRSSKGSGSDEGGLRRRAMSFSSSSMLDGAFPSSMQMPDPVINACMYFDDCPDEAAMLDVIQKLFEYERFRGVPRRVSGGAWVWADAASRPQDHLREFRCASTEALHQKIEEIKSDPLLYPQGPEGPQTDKPLFEFVLLHNESRGELSCVVARVHHSIGDGLSLMLVMQRMITDADGAPIEVQIPGKQGGPKKARTSGSGKMKTDPASTLWALFKVLTLGMTPFDTDMGYSQKRFNDGFVHYNGQRRIVYFPEMELSFLKSLKESAGVTLNDVLMAAFSGALRRYSEKTGVEFSTGREQARALLPVAFPRRADVVNDYSRCLRNKWAFVSAHFAVTPASARERLQQQAAEMNVLKTTPVAPIQSFMQNSVMASLPWFVVHKLVGDSFARHTCVFSNVPGPQEPVYFAGRMLRKIHMVFPNALMQVGILSYNGQVFMNSVVDLEAQRHPGLLSFSFAEELVELAGELNVQVPTSMSDWMQENTVNA
mmetsp:Transcript_10711/g.40248  ORF Transcript_10711/g.40248 Transcript_10711/m.40248 type:complete len:503 (-) Transcript_10711:1612-3120(-)